MHIHPFKQVNTDSINKFAPNITNIYDELAPWRQKDSLGHNELNHYFFHNIADDYFNSIVDKNCL